MGIPPSIAQLIDESDALERTGDLAAALQRACQALEMARDLGQPLAIASALTTTAKIRFRLGQYLAAQASAQEALALATEDAFVRADALLLLGMCAAETDSLVEAESFFHRAADLGREIGYPRVRIRALHDLAAGVYIPRGQFDLALAADEEAQRMVRQHDCQELAGFPLITIAWACLLSGRRQRARTALDELGQMVLPGSAHEGYHHYLAAILALDEGEVEAALPLLTHARSIAEAIGDPGLNVEVRLAMSRYQQMMGNPSHARDWAHDALTFARRVGYRHMEGRALIEHGRTAWLCGDGVAAEADLRMAMEILEALQANFDLTRARLLIAALLHSQRRVEAVAAWVEAARQINIGGYACLLEQERRLAFPLVAVHLNSPDRETKALSATLLNDLQRVPPPTLRIFTLGRFEVWQAARLIKDSAWNQRRAGELFRLLLISPRHSLSEEQVFEALWPEKEPGTADAAFHQATSALRRILEPDLPDKFPSRYLQVKEGFVTLHIPPGSWVDFEAFEAYIQREDWQAALTFYQGELFPNDRYAGWAVWPRERLAHFYLRALLETAQQHMEAERPQEALELCHRILELDPWQENAVLIGMWANMALGQRAAALRLYRNLERALQEELGITPQPALRRFYQSLL